MPNWKAPGPDYVQGFCLNNFKSIQEGRRRNLQMKMEKGNVPMWMTKGRTILMQKDKEKGKAASNYRTITCLPLVWKLLTGVIAEEVYGFLDTNLLLRQEQEGYRRKSRGVNDLLFIDKMLMREVKMRKRKLSMTLIDYKKAYDRVPHSWIIDCLETVGINEKIGRLLAESMKSWRVELISGEENLGEVNIRRGIFQGDSLLPLLFVVCLLPLTHILRDAAPGYHFASNGQKVNHLLFMDDLELYASNEKSLGSLIQTVRVFSNGIGMEFGVEKCLVLTMKKGKMINSDGIVLPNKRTMKGLKEGDSYKYLGVIQAYGMKHHEMKEKVKTEYYRRVRKILETKLNGGNIITGVNTWALSLVRFSAAFLDWTGAELEQMDRRTRKLMAMHRALNPKSDVARLYLSRKEGGRGLISVEGTVKLAILGLERYVLTSEGGLLIAARRVDGDYEQHLGND